MVVGVLGPFFRVFAELPRSVPELRLGTAEGGGYTLALMNEAVRPGPENPQQALDKQGSGQQAPSLLQFSVVVPTYNERDNVIQLFHKL